MLRSLALLLLLCTSAAEVAAKKRADPCRSGDATACFRAKPEPLLSLFGLSPASTYLADGVPLRRAAIIDGFSRPRVAVEFVRMRGAEPTVRLYRGIRRTLPAGLAATAPISSEQWNEIIESGRSFERDLAPPPKSADFIIVCADAPSVVVEAVQPDAPDTVGKYRAKVSSTCETPPSAAYQEMLFDRALSSIPSCRNIDERNYSVMERLEICAILFGDRAAAADAYNAIAPLIRGRDGEQRDTIVHLMRGAHIDWQGVSIVEKPEEVWWDRATGANAPHFEVVKVSATQPFVGRIDGMFSRWVNQSTDLEIAPVQIDFVKASWGGMRIKSIVVGAFAKVETNCNPNRLTGGGNC